MSAFFFTFNSNFFQTVKLGALAMFETSVRGSPNPEVTWYLNGQKLEKTTSGVIIESNVSEHKLTLDSSQYSGTVLCRLTFYSNCFAFLENVVKKDNLLFDV